MWGVQLYLTILAFLATGVIALPPPQNRVVRLSPDVLEKREIALRELARADAEGAYVHPAVRQILGIGRSDGFAPYKVDCPTGWTWIRSADSLSTFEQQALATRQPLINASIPTMLAAHGVATPPRMPVLGFALSGGGYRAMQSGLGGVMATMNSSSEAAASGIGGWFEGMSYMAGLSGGSWATGSFMVNGGMSPLDLAEDIWNLESNLVFPDDDQLSFYSDLLSNVEAKKNEGFPTAITDYWSLALGEHLLPPQFRMDTSPNYTMANLTTVPEVLNGSLPIPIIIAAEREPGELVVAENATVWEFTPWEFGSWAFGSDEKVRGAFTNMQYLGSELNNGETNGTCWNGFDQLSFVMGTSSTLFSGAFLEINGTNSDSLVTQAIEALLGAISADENDVALYPNSFANWNAQPNPIANFSQITLVDAGLTNQNLPLEPLLVPEREVDAIIAFDSSADTTYSWPNGSAMYTTYNRAVVLAHNQNVSIRMPQVPSTNGFVNGGYNTRPTFFGCESNGTTPIIVYVPSYPWSGPANHSTYQLSYTLNESLALINNGLRSLTLNSTVFSWPQCLACALTDRAFGYTSANRTGECQACFNTWCWDGTDNTTTPATYEPVIGSVPPWLVSKDLASASGGAAPGAPAPAATSNAATTDVATSSAGLQVPLAMSAFLLPAAAVAASILLLS